MIYLFHLELCNNKKTPAQGSVIPATPLMERCDPSHINPILSAGIQPRSHLPGCLPTPWQSREPSPNQMPFAAGLGDAQEWDISAPEQFPPLEGLLTAPTAGPGWALQLNSAKGSWMIQISDPACGSQRSGVQDCKPSADTAEQSALACAQPRA